jgi:hypothetical protein
MGQVTHLRPGPLSLFPANLDLYVIQLQLGRDRICSDIMVTDLVMSQVSKFDVRQRKCMLREQCWSAWRQQLFNEGK